jgi:hypothetical protein
MTELLQVLKPSDPRWDGWLQLAPHDFYHLAAYHEVADAAGEGTPEMVIFGTSEKFLAWPYLVRDLGANRSDATSVYGYVGPIGRGLNDDAFRMAAWDRITDFWIERGLVTIFTRFHPLLGNHAICDAFKGAEPTPGGEILNLGRSVYIDLIDDRKTRRSKYRKELRRVLRRGEAMGLTVELDPDWLHYENFLQLYEMTMRRNGAENRYHFQREYFDNLRSSLGGLFHLAVAQVDTDIAASMMFSNYNGIAQAHLAGVDLAYSELTPLKGLIDGIADIARDLGATRFNIGAGRGGAEDQLYQFKSQFSKTRRGFKIGRWVLDGAANAELCAKIAPEADPVFFPAYRSINVPRAVA